MGNIATYIDKIVSQVKKEFTEIREIRERIKHPILKGDRK
jgi:hypothetical protein